MKKKITNFLLFAFIVLFILMGKNLSFVQKYLYPPLYAFGSDVRRHISSFLFFNRLIEENEKLKKEYANLLYLNTKISALEDENKRLKKIVSYTDENNFDFVLTKIVSVKEKGGEYVYIIDKGKDDGVREGLLVVDENRFLVGNVFKVEKGYSYVRTVVSPYFKISFRKQDAQKVLGILKGDSAYALESDMVSRDIDIREDDIVLTTSINDDVSGVLIGKVILVEDDENLVFKKVFVSPLSDLDNVKFLSVIIPKIN